MNESVTIKGGCHCGELEWTLHISRFDGIVRARECACTYCQNVGASWTSFPDSELSLTGQTKAGRYRFGTSTADFVFCARCGVTVAAIDDSGDNDRAVINVRTIRNTESMQVETSRHDFEGESRTDRLQRRRNRWIPRVSWLGALVLSLGLFHGAEASFLEDRGLIDPADGMLDASDYLASAYGFLPVPIFITEPAVGYGLGFAVAYFHDAPEIDREEHTHTGPPSITVGLGGYTENDTWFAGAAHQGVWKEDHVRYTGALLRMSINARWYGLNSGQDAYGAPTSRGINFNSDGGVLYQAIKFRIRESNWWWGGQYLYSDIDNTFKVDIPDLPVDLPGIVFNTKNAGLGLQLQYDGRNTTFTPTTGTRFDLRFTNYDDNWGGDFAYDIWEAGVFQYFPFGDFSSLGLRLEGDVLKGDAPFFAYPFVDLRGIAALRYQGEEVLNAEIEYLWGFTPRWSLVLFTGVGMTWGEEASGGADETVHTYGVGTRYRLAKKFGLQGGFDVARGPEDTSFYITVGSAWR